MAFGYVPHRVFIKDLISRVIGCPDLIRRLQAPAVMKMLNVSPGDVILDGGCGNGHFSFELSKKCRVIVGCDLSLTDRLGSAVKKNDNVCLVRADVITSPFRAKVFNKILLSSVLQAVSDDRALLGECRRVLDDRGLIVISASLDYVCFKWLNERKDFLKKKFKISGRGYYSRAGLDRLLIESGFEMTKFEYSPRYAGSFIYELLLTLAYRCRIAISGYLLFPLSYPLAWIDRLVSQDKKGSEVIIAARKAGA